MSTDRDRDPMARHATAIAAAKRVVRAYADSHADCFGGQWLEYEHDGPVLIVAFTGDTSLHEAALGLPRVRIVGVTRTDAELMAVAEQLRGDELEAAGARMTAWGPDVRANVVSVRAFGPPEAESAARELLRARFGDAVRLDWPPFA